MTLSCEKEEVAILAKVLRDFVSLSMWKLHLNADRRNYVGKIHMNCQYTKNNLYR